MYDAIEYRGNSQADVEALARVRGRPRVQRLDRRVAPDADARRLPDDARGEHKPYDEISYAFVGDCRFNMGRSLLVMGALMGSDVRLGGSPELCAARRTSSTVAKEIAGARGAQITITEDPAEAVRGRRLRPHRRLGLDGRGEGRLDGTSPPAGAVPGQQQTLLSATGNQKAKFMHCLPAFHDPNTAVGTEMMEHTGMDERPRGHG